MGDLSFFVDCATLKTWSTSWNKSQREPSAALWIMHLFALLDAIYEREVALSSEKVEAEKRLHELADRLRGGVPRDVFLAATKERMRAYRKRKREEENAKIPPRA
jgi:hypothetical protein